MMNICLVSLFSMRMLFSGTEILMKAILWQKKYLISVPESDV